MFEVGQIYQTPGLKVHAPIEFEYSAHAIEITSVSGEFIQVVSVDSFEFDQQRTTFLKQSLITTMKCGNYTLAGTVR